MVRLKVSHFDIVNNEVKGFYSKLVRLKGSLVLSGDHGLISFYSKLVRLKAVVNDRVYKDVETFLFQIGSIKRH